MRKRDLFPFLLGPAGFLLLKLSGHPDTMSPEAWDVLCTTWWIAVWWVTEAVPIAVTALLPIVLFPLTGALDIGETTEAYGHKYIFLYMGGFMLAIAIERWNLHRRIALNIIRFIGSDTSRIILGFMVATAFLSMWISNTATSVMMLPIGTAIVSQFNQKENDGDASPAPFGKALMLAIAYSASIGGVATLIGTPPNLVLAGILEETYNVKITFLQWMMIGLPVSLLLLFLAWRYLTRYAFRFDDIRFPAGRQEIARMIRGLGRMSYEEKAVTIVFVLTGAAWISRSLLERVIPRIDDTIIAIAAGIILFALPDKSRTRRLLSWKEALRLPWGIILLFGGGMALARGFTTTGLAEWIAGEMSRLDGLSLILLILVLVVMVNFLTEITSNLATTAMLLPVLAPMALSLNIHPFMIMVPVTIAASCAFMLPVATPPNAVVFGSGYLHIPDMVRTGLIMNLVSVLLVTALTYLLLPWLWGFDPMQFPESFRVLLTP